MVKSKSDKTKGGQVDDLQKEVERRVAGGELTGPEVSGVRETPMAEVTDAGDESEVTRVFRILFPRKKEARKGIVTLMTTKHIQNGTEVPGQFKKLHPNHADQYVLNAGAAHYQDQLAVLRKFEKNGDIAEVPAKTLGVPFISPEEIELAALERKTAKLKAELGMSAT